MSEIDGRPRAASAVREHLVSPAELESGDGGGAQTASTWPSSFLGMAQTRLRGRKGRSPTQLFVLFVAGVVLLYWARRGMSSTRSHLGDTAARGSSKRRTPFSSPVYDEHPVIRPLRNATSLARFRDNLVANERYITSQTYLGFNNQFQSMMHLLYLALRTKRVAIIPPLQPIHIEPPSFPRASEFFDLERLQRATGVALVEWADLKAGHSALAHAGDMAWEEIACWSTREASVKQAGAHQAGDDVTFDEMGLETVMWPLPEHIQGSHWNYVQLDAVIAFDADARYKAQWTDAVEAGNSTRRLPPPGAPRPDDALLCLDDTFWMMQALHPPSPSYEKPLVGPQTRYFDIGIADRDMPGWHAIGQHVHWTADVERETDAFLRFTLGLSDRAPIPAYIGAHIRHGDFGSSRTLDGYVVKVDEVRRQLDEDIEGPFYLRAASLPVICSTDETDPAFLQKVAEMGWYIVDHDAFGSIARHPGPTAGWWPTVLSSSYLGRSQGFVGTHWSTFSIYSWIRVLAWTPGGVGAEVE